MQVNGQINKTTCLELSKYTSEMQTQNGYNNYFVQNCHPFIIMILTTCNKPPPKSNKYCSHCGCVLCNEFIDGYNKHK